MTILNKTRGFLLLCMLIKYLPLAAKRYRSWGRGLNNDEGLFFVTEDNAASGIIMLIGCSITAFICLKLAVFIDKDEESKGIGHYVTMILGIIGIIATIAAVGLAYVLWWIMLIIFVICVICVAIYQKIKENYDRNESNNNIQEPKVKEKTLTVPNTEQNKKGSSYNKVNPDNTKLAVKDKIKEIDRQIVRPVAKEIFNIKLITLRQRRATFGLIAYLGKRLYESDQADADKIINTYAEILQINKTDYDFILSWVPFNGFLTYFWEVEKIRIDEYWNFLFKAWRKLIEMDTGKRKLLYYKLYKTMKKALDFTDEEITTVLQGKDIHKFNS